MELEEAVNCSGHCTEAACLLATTVNTECACLQFELQICSFQPMSEKVYCNSLMSSFPQDHVLLGHEHAPQPHRYLVRRRVDAHQLAHRRPTTFCKGELYMYNCALQWRIGWGGDRRHVPPPPPLRSSNYEFIVAQYSVLNCKGFDPDYELIKNTRPVSNKTPDDRIVMLVIAIELEVKNEQFRLCFMSQNRAVVENKRVLPSRASSLYQDLCRTVM